MIGLLITCSLSILWLLRGAVLPTSGNIGNHEQLKDVRFCGRAVGTRVTEGSPASEGMWSLRIHGLKHVNSGFI